MLHGSSYADCWPVPLPGHRFQFYPVLLSNIDPELQELILPLTWIQKEVIIPWVLTAKNRGFWEVSLLDVKMAASRTQTS